MTTAELVEHLRAQAMTLPEKDRLQLVVTLSDSLGPVAADDQDTDQGSFTPEWHAEIRRRVENIRNGTSKGIPAKEAFAALRATLVR